MKDTKPEQVQDTAARREFLKGAAVASAAVGAAALATTAVADEITSEPVAKRKLGYQETDHVRDYYRLARF